ncbi:Glycosyltransferase [Legionella wadsworthii]|uniref:Glycosyltransferase n=1 Tax=Legionella wadsworthii TaxID=28088 RepID=A0A378LSW8_9GAMM|nr:glycosyltransferase family 1 protein [Legionella wadsworthii]STY28929.1 Glycosyltransferase [Legionella wadsworthii]
MKLILNVTRMLGTLLTGHYSGTGVDRVLLSYIHNYKKQARAFVHYPGIDCIYSQKISRELFDYILQSTEHLQTMRQSLRIKGMLLQRNHQDLDKSIFLHIDQFPHKFKLIHQLNIPMVSMVHDLIPIHYAEYSDKKKINRHIQFLNHSIHGSGIITNSQNTLDDLSAYCLNLHKSRPPMISAPLASGLPLHITPGPRLVQEPYFVIISTIEGRKNHLTLLHIWRRLIAQFSGHTPKLVIIGKRGWKCEQVLDLLDHCKQLKPFIIEESSCSDQKLVTYLHHAQALLFPSFSEGYGLPLVEALSYATPVIASNIPVFYEIAGNIPEYIDPLDTIKWMQTIEEYCRTNSSMRAAQMERLKFFKTPTWTDHFHKVDGFLQNIVGS